MASKVEFSQNGTNDPEKLNTLWNSWDLFFGNLSQKGIFVLRNAEIKIWNINSITVTGFICRTNKGGTVRIEPLLIHENNEGYCAFSFSNGNIKALYTFDDSCGLSQIEIWDETKEELVEEKIKYPNLGQSDLVYILSLLKRGPVLDKVILGFLPVEVVYLYFFGKDESNLSFSGADQIKLLRQLKYFFQKVSPSVYDNYCAQLLSNITEEF